MYVCMYVYNNNNLINISYRIENKFFKNFTKFFVSTTVVDSFGSVPKTFTWGNYFWFGTPDLCDDLNQPFTISLSRSKPPIFNATSPFPMQFVIVYLNFTTPFYIDLKLPFEVSI